MNRYCSLLCISKKGTGKTLADWFQRVESEGLGKRPHKEIADYLHTQDGVSHWWAHSILQVRVTGKGEGKTVLNRCGTPLIELANHFFYDRVKQAIKERFDEINSRHYR